MKLKRIALITMIFLCYSMNNATAQKTQNESIRLIVRGDDLGMTQGSIDAFEKAITYGVLTCASIQVPGPWFEAAADLSKRHPEFCFGIHLTLVAEWRGYRWRPVLPYDEVPSLVDEDGYLYQSPADLLAANPNPHEVEAELRAQIDLAQKRGIRISYLDNHYFDINSIPGCNNIKEKLASEYGVVISGSVGEMIAAGNYYPRRKDTPVSDVVGIYLVPEEQKLESAVGMLEELKPGLWIWVCHPGINSPEQNALIHALPEHIRPGQGVGAHRAKLLEVLTNISVKSTILRRSIELTDYNKIK